jgi:hypothetical protein
MSSAVSLHAERLSETRINELSPCGVEVRVSAAVDRYHVPLGRTEDSFSGPRYDVGLAEALR